MPTGGKAAPVKPIKVDVVSAHADDHDLDPDWRETKEIEVEIKNLATARAGGVAYDKVDANGEAAAHRPIHLRGAISAVTAAERVQEGSWQSGLARRPSVMANATRRVGNFKVGQRLFDEAHGQGTVISSGSSDGDVTVKFDPDGSEHTYSLSTQRKLKPVIEDTHAYSANDLFDLVDADRYAFPRTRLIFVQGGARRQPLSRPMCAR